MKLSMQLVIQGSAVYTVQVRVALTAMRMNMGFPQFRIQRGVDVAAVTGSRLHLVKQVIVQLIVSVAGVARARSPGTEVGNPLPLLPPWPSTWVKFARIFRLHVLCLQICVLDRENVRGSRRHRQRGDDRTT